MLNRKEFLKIGSLGLLATIPAKWMVANAAGGQVDYGFLQLMTDANDRLVSVILASGPPTAKNFSRRTGQDLATVSASWVTKGSRYYQDNAALARMEQASALLLQLQAPDGTVSVGNLESPPDTAFLLESLTAAAYLLQKSKTPAAKVSAQLKTFLQHAGEALITGGVHTPNHRWVICGALARLNRLYPDQRYIDRIDQWLAEGIYNDADGHYPERSQVYSNVENNSLITMSRLLNRPELLEPVTKNLWTEFYYMEPNGDLVTFDSRRQDQYSHINIAGYYFHYRFMANRQQDHFFAAVARFIETLPGFSHVIDDGLYHALDNELLQEQLPSAETLPTSFEKLFTTSALLRIRRGDTTATLFGGTDQPIQVASGRSNSPNIFAYAKGQAILEYLRLSTSFFSTGYFYSEGITKDENSYVLHKTLEVPYYQPLPKDKLKPDGDYKLSPSVDDRFWNKMDFSERPVSNLKTLDTKVSLKEDNGKCALHFQVTGQPGVAVTIELCFKAGGKLDGVVAKGDDNYFMDKAEATYSMGDSVIHFGPGVMANDNIKNLEGEKYSTHFGNLRTEGMHVFLTGITPFDHELLFS